MCLSAVPTSFWTKHLLNIFVPLNNWVTCFISKLVVRVVDNNVDIKSILDFDDQLCVLQIFSSQCMTSFFFFLFFFCFLIFF